MPHKPLNYMDNQVETTAPARPMYERRHWGTYQVIDMHTSTSGHNSLTKHIIIDPGCNISYQYHDNRAEVWTIIGGSGLLIVDGIGRRVDVGDVVKIAPKQLHAIRALKTLHIIEVQIGSELTEEDITRLPWPEEFQ